MANRQRANVAVGSLWSRVHGEEDITAVLSPWPVGRPANWAARVNAPLTASVFPSRFGRRPGMDVPPAQTAREPAPAAGRIGLTGGHGPSRGSVQVPADDLTPGPCAEGPVDRQIDATFDETD
jgi:hypothetical protein